ncbi:HD-domain/PDEase-like protein [Hesseltinella vesiculosa]|uniref:Phosphodiesterase n=1 Tax=Hesseltinella vesiculosa TaxID=101127 RepID=A0A1X2GYH5_9FUNG|nr:HD-domain/PDEase-like protein [Hesseltinella vesiculosa]
MNPSQCHILVITDNEASDRSLSLLHKIFNYVFYVPSSRDVEQTLDLLRRHQKKNLSTLILIDAQTYTEDTLFSTMAEFQQAVRQLDNPTLHTAMVVYSSETSAQFMSKCLDHGAIDYIVKPLSSHIVSTIYLNLTRFRLQQRSRLKGGSDIPSHKTVDNSVFSNIFHNNIWSAFFYRLLTIYDFSLDTTPSVPKENGIHSAYIRKDMKQIKSILCEQQTWDFAPFKFSQTELMQCAFFMLKQALALPGLEHINIMDDSLYDFLLDVANMYHELNPYHNFQHAVDVMQSTYYFLCRMGVIQPMDPAAYKDDLETQLSTYKNEQKLKELRGACPWMINNGRISEMFTSIDVLALLFASLGHDIGHPGLTNMFLVRTSNPLAMLYNDRSVLENFHATVFFNILQYHGFRSNGGWLSPQDFVRFRSVIVQSILATDMGLHDEYVRRIQELKTIINNSPVDPSLTNLVEPKVLLICGSLIKCADISNCARPFHLAKRWAKILKEEFSEQGDLEKCLGLPVLPFLDREQIGLAQFQLDFKRTSAAKLFESVADIIPDMQYSVVILKANCDAWQVILDRKDLKDSTGVSVDDELEQQEKVTENSDPPGTVAPCESPNNASRSIQDSPLITSRQQTQDSHPAPAQPLEQQLDTSQPPTAPPATVAPFPSSAPDDPAGKKLTKKQRRKNKCQVQ